MQIQSKRLLQVLLHQAVVLLKVPYNQYEEDSLQQDLLVVNSVEKWPQGLEDKPVMYTVQDHLLQVLVDQEHRVFLGIHQAHSSVKVLLMVFIACLDTLCLLPQTWHKEHLML